MRERENKRERREKVREREKGGREEEEVRLRCGRRRCRGVRGGVRRGEGVG